MKVLHVISSGGMYGAEAVILNLSRTMNRMNGATGSPHRSSLGIFTSKVQTNDELYAAAAREGVEAFPILCVGQFDRRVTMVIRELARRLEADVVHAHGYKADVYSWFALRRTSIRLISTCHTWYDNDAAVRMYGAIDRWLLRRFDQVVGVSEEVRARLLSAGVKTEKVCVIPNGIDLHPFARVEAHDDSSTPQRVGLVGRLAPEKGCDLFIRAAALVLAEVPGAQFYIAGDGPDRASLGQLIGQLKVEKIVQLMGRCDDMPSFYGSLDVLVSASRREGLPIALLEGMAAALPLVATRAGEVPTLVLDGVTGLLVPVEDVAALANAMLTLLRDSDLRRHFGAAGRERIASLYSAERMTADYLAVYEHVVQGSRGRRARIEP